MNQRRQSLFEDSPELGRHNSPVPQKLNKRPIVGKMQIFDKVKLHNASQSSQQTKYKNSAQKGAGKDREGLPNLNEKTGSFNNRAGNKDTGETRLRQISFANDIRENPNQQTPISVEELNGDLQVPEMMPKFGTFIPQHKSPRKSYEIMPDPQLSKVPDFRAESTTSRPKKKERDMSHLVKQNEVGEIPFTTSQKIAACRDKTCTSTVRYDDERSDATLDVFAKRHPDDLVDMYRQNQKAQEAMTAMTAMTEVLMGLAGLDNEEKQNSPGSLQHQLSGNRSQNSPTKLGTNRLAGIREEMVIYDDHNSDLISLDAVHEESCNKVQESSVEDDEEGQQKANSNNLRSYTVKSNDFKNKGQGSKTLNNNDDIDLLLKRATEDPVIGMLKKHKSQDPRMLKVASNKSLKGHQSKISDYLGKQSSVGTNASPSVGKNSSQMRRNATVLAEAINLPGVPEQDTRVPPVMDAIFAADKSLLNELPSKFQQLRQQQQTKKLMKMELNKQIDQSSPLSDILTISFQQFMQLLCAPNDLFHGCELKFVETAYFDNKLGKATEIIHTNKEGFVCSIRSEKRLQQLAIQKFFTEMVRERRKTAPPAWREQFDEELALDSALLQNQMSVTQGSELNYFESFQRVATAQTNDFTGTVGKTSQRDKSVSEYDGKSRFSFMAQRSNMSKGKSSISRKSTTSQATKRVDRAANLDLAIFRFAVNPETLPHNTRIGDQQQQQIIPDQTSKSPVGPSASNNQAIFKQTSEVNMEEDKVGDDKHLMGPFTKIVQEKMFSDMMTERAASRQWRAIECIQACVKAQKGLGKHIPIRFTMQLDLGDQRDLMLNKDKKKEYINAPTLGLTYDYNAVGQDYRKEILSTTATSVTSRLGVIEVNELIEQKLKILRPKDFCLRQVLKMCYYIQKLHEIEILQINCDFYQDDNGEIWLFHSDNVLIRQQMKSQAEREFEDQVLRDQNMKREKRQELIRLERAAWKTEKENRERSKEPRENIFKEKPKKMEGSIRSTDQQKRGESMPVPNMRRIQLQKIKKFGQQMGLDTNTSQEAKLSDQDKDDCESENLSQQEQSVNKKYAQQFHRYFIKNISMSRAREFDINQAEISTSEEFQSKADMIKKDRHRLQRLPEKREAKPGSSQITTQRTQNIFMGSKASQSNQDYSASQLKGFSGKFTDPQIAQKMQLSKVNAGRFGDGAIASAGIKKLSKSRDGCRPIRGSLFNKVCEQQIEANHKIEFQAGNNSILKDQTINSNEELNSSLDQYKLHSTARSQMQTIADSSKSQHKIGFLKYPSITDKSYFNSIRDREQSSIEVNSTTQQPQNTIILSSAKSASSHQISQKNMNFTINKQLGCAGRQTMMYGFSSGEEPLVDQTSLESHSFGEPVLNQGNGGGQTFQQLEQPHIPLIGPNHSNFCVKQVKKDDGSRIYLINKGRNLNIESSNINIQAVSTKDGSQDAPFVAVNRTQFISIRPPQTANPGARIKPKQNLTSNLTHSDMNIASFRDGRASVISTLDHLSQLNLSGPNYFNLPAQTYTNQLASKRGSIYEKNIRYQQKPRAKGYLRSIDRQDLDQPSFFHLPDPKKVQRSNNLHFAKARSRTQKGQSGQPKHTTPKETRKKKAVGLSGRKAIRTPASGRQQDIIAQETELGLRRTTLVSKYLPMQQYRHSGVTISTDTGYPRANSRESEQKT